MNNEYRRGDLCCNFHEKQVIIGVCPMCLNERLVILAAKQQSGDQEDQAYNISRNQRRIRFIPKIFALGSLLSRFDQSHHDEQHKLHYVCYSYSDASTTSPEDSFISIKFEENGVSSWEKKKMDYSKTTNNSTTVVLEDAAKPRGGSLRWRKRIGHMLQLSRWKTRPTKGSVVGSSKVVVVVEGVKVTNTTGWLRSLTKRRRAME